MINKTIFDRIDKLNLEVFKNQGDIAKAFDLSEQNLSRHKNEKTEPNFIPKLRKFIELSNITPEELYFILIGRYFDKGNGEKTESDLPRQYIAQTNTHIKKLEEQIEDLKHQRDFLENALMKSLDRKEDPAPVVVSKVPHPEGQPRQPVGLKVVGKNLKTTAADP